MAASASRTTRAAGTPRATPLVSGRVPRSLPALVLANARYWSTVAPVLARELPRWRAAAAQIDDAGLRRLADDKLAEEWFNAQVAATLATLVPRQTRAAATRAIVALEVLFDYLDGRTESPRAEALEQGTQLFAPFVRALGVEDRSSSPVCAPDGRYLQALADEVRDCFSRLPSARRVAPTALASATRCAEAQLLLHGRAAYGVQPLRAWALAENSDPGLGWRAFAAGAASSVLALQALLTLAADPATSAADARRVDAAYLAIGAVVTMLDSLVDHSADVAAGTLGFVDLYESREQFTHELCALIRHAQRLARRAPDSAHHAMTLAGAVAYYTTHPGARETHARATVAAVRAELTWSIWPTLAVMRVWRAAKHARQAAGVDRTIIEWAHA